jgi:hypothetical protein
MLESMQQEELAFAAERKNVQEEDAEERYYDAMHEDEYRIQDEMTDPIAFLAKTDEDTMYFHQATKAPDRDEFVKEIVKEMNDHIVRKKLRAGPKTRLPSASKGTRFRVGYEAKKRHPDAKCAEVQSQV